MAYPEDPIETWQFRFFHDRADRQGHEIHGKRDQRRDRTGRLWLVLSDDRVHRRKLAITVPLTHADDRQGPRRTFLVPEPRTEHLTIVRSGDRDDGSRVDVQHLWTFPAERDDTIRPIGELGDQHNVGRIDNALKSYMRPLQPRTGLETAPQLEVGRVTWIEPIRRTLQPALADDRYPIELPVKWELEFDANPPTFVLPKRLPCVVMAAPPGAPGAATSGVSVMTLVPMLNIPWFQDKYGRNPFVAPPWDKSDSARLSVLTMLALSLDYRLANVFSDDGEGHDAWLITEAEHVSIRNHLLAHLGITP